MDLGNLDARIAVSKNLERLLEEKGWNQKDLANESGLSPAVISGYMNAEKFPIYNSLKAMAKALGKEQTEITSHPDLLKAFANIEIYKKEK